LPWLVQDVSIPLTTEGFNLGALAILQETLLLVPTF